ncbi:MAG: hypothetical protein CFH34_01097 [Alphaproteobacteria bacterium MarineAlpha9_Bin4]|nr:hypothetical protein [Pelagibacterales bacterium]PPR26200.1 MAG: hypothetical protein CFH34_01097 [Alphaproteobacteria bacterium MarineAlpha9_Bin4]|tara:strand:- start:1008 stop:1289 length:282 start_codon:yes stop_codon:yes gene_type:complete
MEKIKEIERKLKDLKKKRQETLNNNKINGKYYSMAINVSLELITGIGLGVILGLLVDNHLQTKPIMFIIFFIVGTIVGFYNMYKSLKKYGYFK